MGERGRTGERRRAGICAWNVQPLHVRVSSEAIESGGQLARRRLGDGRGEDSGPWNGSGDPSQPPTKGSCFDDWKTSEDRSSLEEPQYKRSEAVDSASMRPCRIVIAERHRLRPYEPFPVRPVDRERGISRAGRAASASVPGVGRFTLRVRASRPHRIRFGMSSRGRAERSGRAPCSLYEVHRRRRGARKPATVLDEVACDEPLDAHRHHRARIEAVSPKS